MADSTRHCKNRRMSVNMEENLKEHLEIETSETSIRTYENDSDFDEAFKNLLRPIESISKSKNQCEPLKYDLLKELDSYLHHMKSNDYIGSLVFVEASLMIQNVVLIYQKRVDQYVDVMKKLIGKFRAYEKL